MLLFDIISSVCYIVLFTVRWSLVFKLFPFILRGHIKDATKKQMFLFFQFVIRSSQFRFLPPH